jgi:uncharacterized membrane-anchored protein YhcB (DUF1043 family)
VNTTDPHGRSIIALKWSHLIITLLVNLLAIGVLYGTIRAQVDETQRNVQELKDKKVDQRQFDEFRENLVRQLNRIESKLDSLR